jgi:hypothetical protein
VTVSTSPGAPRPAVRGVRFAIAHVPDLVLSGSKPRRELARAPAGERDALRRELRKHRRSLEAAVAYPPHQVLLANLAPEALWDRPRPWHGQPCEAGPARGPGGVLVDQSTFYAWLARADSARLVAFDAGFAETLPPLPGGPGPAGTSPDELRRALAQGAEPLWGELDEPVGRVVAGHEADEALAPAVILENLAAKVTGALALRELLAAARDPAPVDFLLGAGEEAVGDRYQRGGGNLAKAIGELAGVTGAGGVDVKAFCAGPVHALILAGALVRSGLHRRVVVVAGGSLAKLGMKFRGHLAAGYPILEDVLVGVAIEVGPDDGRSPLMRLDMAATHRLGDGDAPHQIATALSAAPLRAHGLRLTDVDRFAVELHNPDITEPAGSGNVPANNYRILGALAARAGELGREDVARFERAHGLPGFCPTQGHIASAIPYLPHAVAGLTAGALRRVQLVAKGSLFLGRMTTMGDGASVVLERAG